MGASEVPPPVAIEQVSEEPRNAQAETTKSVTALVQKLTKSEDMSDGVSSGVQNPQSAPSVANSVAPIEAEQQRLSVTTTANETNGTVPYSADVSAGSFAGQQAPSAISNEITEMSTPKLAQTAPAASTGASPANDTAESPVPATASASLSSPAPATTAQPTNAVKAEQPSPELRAPPPVVTAAVSDPGGSPDKPSSDATPAMPAATTDSVQLKDLPKVAVDAAKQAGQAYVAAGKEARSTLSTLASVFQKHQKEGPPILVTLDQIITVIFLAFVAFQLLLVPIFMPSLFRLVYSLVWGLMLGVGLSFLFYLNQKRKTEVNDLLSVNLGLKGMHLVAGGLPSWFNISQKEKLEWLNSLIVEMWPYVDKGVCDMIKEITAQVMPGVLKTLPAGLGGIVKSIGFKHLTFGLAPFRVESMWVSRDDKGSLVMEVSVKWCGDPNITLAIEVPGGQKLCPRVMDITFVADIRIVLNPLVPRIPGFVAAMATVPKPPLIKYRLDFGKAMGGSMAPAAVTPVVNYFMREVITKMLVWPQRLVVPILQETEQDRIEIQKLMRRHRGVLRVCVCLAKELRPQDWGSNDVLVELTTDSEHFEATNIRRAKPIEADTKEEQERLGETVVFNEYIYLLIQEPKDQLLRLEAFDIDRLRPAKLLTGQVTQVVNGRSLIGRSLVKLADACKLGMEGKTESYDAVTHLGRAEWGSPGGAGKGYGKVRLSMNYWPFERFTKYDVENAMTGIVTVRLLKVWGLSAAGDSLSAFVRVTSSANRKEWRSSVRTWTRRGHIYRLKQEVVRLIAARERDLREGRSKEAERKQKYLDALKDAIDGRTAKARLMVDMDYMLDSNAMHAIYHMKLTDVIKIKVMESSLLSSAECLGRLDIPVSDVITANDFNPMTGQREFGLHRKRWEEFNPDQPDRSLDDLERGILLEEGDGARIWVELRWVPCIQALGPVGGEVVANGYDDFAAAAALSPPPQPPPPPAP